MQGGVKFYRGNPAAARNYLGADRCRPDDYYLTEGTGLAARYVAMAPPNGGRPAVALPCAIHAAGMALA